MINPDSISGRVFLLLDNHQDLHRNPEMEYFSLIDNIPDFPAFENDVRTINLGHVYDMCKALHARVQGSGGKISLVTSSEIGMFTNSVLIMGAYMIMQCKTDLLATLKCIAREISKNKAIFQSNPEFQLRFKELLFGIMRAKMNGWVDFGPNGFDADEYKHLSSPLNGDLHEVVPGKLVLMQGPRDLPGEMTWQDTKHADGCTYRDFSAAYYADILTQLNVQAVVRCSVPTYDRAGFEAAGIAVVDLCWEDGAPPPIDVVAKFLAVAESIPGAIAVHSLNCGSGRGRSGTLAALYMMKHHGFSAREAMGWLRIVRPGR
jgi:cell division cycle 14